MSFRLEDLTGHVRKVAQCRGSWEHGRKFSPPHTHTEGERREGGREKNDEKPVVNQYWLLRLTGNVTDLCTPSEILADLQKKSRSPLLSHTERLIWKNGKHYIT